MRTLISFGVIFSLAASVSASDDKPDRATLRGVNAVCTIVEITGPTQAGIPVSRERLQADIDGRLAANGIAVNKDATTCLYLHVQILPAVGKNNKPVGLSALDLGLQFVQMVALARDLATKTYAPTWSVSNLATVPAEEIGTTARQITIDLADRFVEAYRSVNPK